MSLPLREHPSENRVPSTPNRTLVVVSHTHWDREWYQPFEAFRARLVRMMDSLLDLLERDPEYKHFVLDGQTVPLDDYLEIRPDRRADIERLVRDGRLLIGPNYMLPDEFLIGGEAHDPQPDVRASARRGSTGELMMVGYSPDAFGHIAHLPAILRGFGIDSVLIWRGVGPEATTSRVPLGGAGRLRGAGGALRRTATGYMAERCRRTRTRCADASRNVRNLAGAAGHDELRARTQRHRPPARAHRAVAGDPHGERAAWTTPRWCTATTRTFVAAVRDGAGRRAGTTKLPRARRASSGPASGRTCWPACSRRGCG